MNQTRTVSNKKISGTVKVPQSKALLHRYLICSGLSKENPLIICTNDSDDVMATKRCLVDLGLENGAEAVTFSDSIYRLECTDCASTYKFLMPVACALNKKCRYQLSDRLSYNSMDSFYKALRPHGVRKDALETGLIEVSGQMTAGTFLIPGTCDGQALSGLLLALPLLKENSTVMVEKAPESESYVDMTVEIMREAGIQVNTAREEQGISRIYKVNGGQKYDLDLGIAVEGDWSLAAFFLVSGAITGSKVTCTDMNIRSLQGDRRILKILDLFGARIEIRKSREHELWHDISVCGGKLSGIRINAREIPDLIAPVMLLASAAEGVTVLKNAAGLRMSRERLGKMADVLNGLGGQAAISGNDLLIAGNSGAGLEGGTVSSNGDHRMAMMAAAAAGICKNEVIIENSDVVSKSYPGFYGELERMKN